MEIVIFYLLLLKFSSCIIAASKPTKSSTKHTFFTKVPGQGDELPKENIISSYAVHSQLECSHRCLQTSRSVGFNYRPKSNKYAVNCQISNKNRARNEMTNEVKREWIFYYSLKEFSVKLDQTSTTQPTLSPQHEQCSGYTWLSETSRNKNSGSASNCDSNLSGWYRFGGGAGTKIATSCVPSNRCGTHASGWMNGVHPTVADGEVTRTVCFSYATCCEWSNEIKVVNCGQYYVYKLMSTSATNPCSLGYCGSYN